MDGEVGDADPVDDESAEEDPILFTRNLLRNTNLLCPIPTTGLSRVLMDWMSKTYAI